MIYVHQVLLGLDFLHSQGVIHRDIKGDNILTTKDGEIKLADFGVSVMLEQTMTCGESKHISFAGTPFWMAPEVIQGETVTAASDIWSLGCTIIELLTGKPPYFELNQYTAMTKIVNEKSPPIPKDISDQLRDFLQLCFEKEPSRRISAKGLLKHEWMGQVEKESLIQEIIQMNGSSLNLLPESIT